MTENTIRSAHVSETGESKYAVAIEVSGHKIKGDEPVSSGGSNLGPAPYDTLLAALGECTVMTVRWYALQQGWPLERAEAILTHEKDGIITHLYTEVIGDDVTKPQNQEYLQSNPVKIDEPTKQEGSHQDEAVAQEEDKSSHGEHSEYGKELPQTGQAELPNTGTEDNARLAALGLFGVLSGFGIVARKKKED